jgi:ADP-ribose pyrophosphatase
MSPKQCGAATAIASLALLLLWASSWPTNDSDSDSGLCYSGGSYMGSQWTKPSQTLKYRTVVETPFARVQLHTVRSEDGTQTFEDWLWLDTKDQVNVLVRLKGSGLFPLFRQSKYGLPQATLATIGGFVDEWETPLDAAKRELNEELGLQSEHWMELGSWRADVNRGGGTVSAFLAEQAVPAETRQQSDDSEEQLQLQLTEAELLEAALTDQFGEVKWQATVATALLRLRQRAETGGSGGG